MAVERHTCPRRDENGMIQGQEVNADTWRKDGTCSYCGSVRPDVFLHLADSGVEVGPTDKNYKAYIEIPDPEEGKLRVVSTTNAKEKPGDGWQRTKPWERRLKGVTWVLKERRGPTKHGKFYFQHLSPDQQREFIAMLNARKVNIGYPGRFYRLPYFVRPAA